MLPRLPARGVEGTGFSDSIFCREAGARALNTKYSISIIPNGTNPSRTLSPADLYFA